MRKAFPVLGRQVLPVLAGLFLILYGASSDTLWLWVGCGLIAGKIVLRLAVLLSRRLRRASISWVYSVAIWTAVATGVVGMTITRRGVWLLLAFAMMIVVVTDRWWEFLWADGSSSMA